MEATEAMRVVVTVDSRVGALTWDGVEATAEVISKATLMRITAGWEDMEARDTATDKASQEPVVAGLTVAAMEEVP